MTSSKTVSFGDDRQPEIAIMTIQTRSIYTNIYNISKLYPKI